MVDPYIQSVRPHKLENPHEVYVNVFGVRYVNHSRDTVLLDVVWCPTLPLAFFSGAVSRELRNEFAELCFHHTRHLQFRHR